MQQFARHKHRWEGNGTFDFKGTEWEDVEMIHLTEIRDYWQALVNAGANFLALKMLQNSSLPHYL